MRAYLFAAVAASCAMPTFAGTNICWFDHVSASDGRLVLHFSSNASLLAGSQGKQYLIRHGSIYPADANGNPQIVEGVQKAVELSLASGESLTAMQTPEDACRYTVTERDGQRGLLLTASFGGTSGTAFLLPE